MSKRLNTLLPFFLLLATFVSGNAFCRVKPTALVRTNLGREVTIEGLAGQGVDILHIYPDGRCDLAVTDEQLDWLRSRTLTVSVLERAGFAAPLELDADLGSYHTYSELLFTLSALASAYPDLTHLDTLGTSNEGRLICAIKISDNAGIDEDEAEVLIMGCHHSRELMSVEIPLLLAEHLLTHYGTSPEVTRLVDGREMWFVPMVNPDGHVYVENDHSGEWWTWWRKNRRDNGDGTYGVDLNRNYGYMWGYDDAGSSPLTSSQLYRGTAPFSEPETQAVRDFCIGRSFAAAISYHSYGELILYPWGYETLFTDDHEFFTALGDSLSRGNGYLPGNAATGTIYKTNGDSDDWAYGETTEKNRIFSVTVELNSYEQGGFAPPEGLIQPTFGDLLDLNLSLIRIAEDPYKILGPRTPAMQETVLLNPPNFELSWSGAEADDPNRPVAWDVIEYKNLEGVLDSCEAGDTLWNLEGFSLSTDRAVGGGSSFYSGSGDRIRNSITMASIYPISLGSTVSCWLWYDIETNWDYAYLEVSLNDGLTWKTVPGDVTTTSNPNGNNLGNGITGNSGGWVAAEFNLLGIEGGVPIKGNLLIRFGLVNDDFVNFEGLYVDMVDPTASCERSAVAVYSNPDTFYHVWPDETGDFAYMVKAVDGEGHKSRGSNVVFHTVEDLSPVRPPDAGTYLAQNYPNPFNPVTTLVFSVGTEELDPSGTAGVFLELFDVSGRRVAVLVDGPMAAGEYTVPWDGRGEDGGLVASGVYFARLAVGWRIFTRKMVLLK